MAKILGEIILDPREGTKDPTKKDLLKKALTIIKESNSAFKFFRNGIEVAKNFELPDLLKLSS